MFHQKTGDSVFHGCKIQLKQFFRFTEMVKTTLKIGKISAQEQFTRFQAGMAFKCCGKMGNRRITKQGTHFRHT